jgi:uncharacterized damage-inducible protein DinB
MAIADAIIRELEFEAKSTARMLERVPKDKLEWRPHEKSMTLGRLAWHVASIPSIAVRVLNAGAFDLGGARPPQPTLDENTDFVAELQRNVTSAVEVLRNFSDDDMRAEFPMRRNGELLQNIARVAFIRSVLMNHAYHHRGQMSVYLRLLDVPVPAMYGTSADETM